MTVRNRPENLKKGSYGVFDEPTETALIKVVQQAIDDNVEIGDIGNEPIFGVCQYFKGILPPADNPSDLFEPFVRLFYDNHEILQDCYDFMEVMLMFEDIWENDKIKYPKMDYFKIALLRADKQTTIRPETAWCKDPVIRRLDNVCFELQKLRKEESFWISQYQAGEVIGKDGRMGRYALDKLERKKNLERHKTGNFKDGTANSYFYIGQAEPPKKTYNMSETEKRKQKMIKDLMESKGK